MRSASTHSRQQTTLESCAPVPTPMPDGPDVFAVPGFSRTTQSTLSLKQPPKWLRRPVSSCFGYGGQLVSLANLPSSIGRNQSSVVQLQKVVMEIGVVQRARRFQDSPRHRVLANQHFSLRLLQPMLLSILLHLSLHPSHFSLETTMKLKEIHQTATFVLSPSPFVPLLTRAQLQVPWTLLFQTTPA